MKFARKNKNVNLDTQKILEDLNNAVKLNIKGVILTPDGLFITAGMDPNPEEMSIIESYIKNNNI